MNEKQMPVFQDLVLESWLDPADFRKALLGALEIPWKHAVPQEKVLTRAMPVQHNVIVFSREKSDGIDACYLSLMLYEEGFKVTNIVPRDVRELGIERYNLILADFLRSVVQRAAKEFNIRVILSEPTLSLSTLVGEQAVPALEAFLSGANKGTGSAHPSDRRRWLEFLVTVHRQSKRPEGEAFERWLVEMEGWPSDTAEQLVEELQFGLALLAYQDHSAL